MKRDTRMFASKVARRAFFLFVGCALIPVSIMALISVRQVTVELHRQNEQRLRHDSKAVGIILHKRLLALEVAIDPTVQEAQDRLNETMQRSFSGIVLVTSNGQRRTIAGEVGTLPTLSIGQLRHIAAGETLIYTAPREGSLPRVFVSRALDRSHPEEGGTLHGEVNPAYLWAMEDELGLDPNTRLMVVDETGMLLVSSVGAGAVPRPVSQQVSVGVAGNFTWNDGSDDYMASYWSLFLRNKFLTPKWVTVLSRPASAVLAPLADFHRTFVLVALLSLFVVLLLSVGQIRTILRPLARLQTATGLLSQGRLDTRVEVSSRDEFEDLAESFNQMAATLSRQFDALSMRSEITAELSRSSVPPSGILQSCGDILARHLDLAIVSGWLTTTEGTTLERCTVSGTCPLPHDTPDCVRVGDGLIGRVAAEGRPYATNTLTEDDRQRFSAGSGQTGMVAFVGHPLVIAGRVQGVMAVFSTRPIDVIDLGSIAASIEEIAQGVERRRVAEALEGSAEQVRQLQKMEAVGSLAGGIAHDFNNLLVVVMGYSQMLLESIDRGDPPCRESVQIIESTAIRAAKLTRQLLAFSRKQVLTPTLLDLNTVVTGMMGLLQRLIGESIELVFAPVENLGLVRLDGGQIEQVLVNLVVNSRDAMPNGGKITIQVATVDLDDRDVARNPGSSRGPNVMIKVTDTGTGMDAATLARIFEPFFTTKEPGKGTGLGLATVHGIVAQSGGSIRVDSAPGRGSSFTLHFPRAVGEVEAPIEADLFSSRGSETVLLAEDEHEVRVLLEQVLKNHGYDVICVSRPSDALRIAQQHAGPIHLLLTDMVMPEMSGAVLAERLCATRPEMAVLQMSGYTEYRSGTSVRANQPAFLQKPFTPGAVARMVRLVLDAHEARAVVQAT